MRPPVPESLEQVDAAWMSAALATRYLGLEISALTVDRIVHGAATKARLRLSFASPTLAVDPVVWIKAGWEPHSEWLAATRIYAREAWFYRDLNPIVKINAPRAFYADFENGWQGVVVIEDLPARGARLTQCTVAASVEEIRRSLAGLARLHASYWDDDFLETSALIDVPMRVDDHTSDWPRANGPEVIARFLDTERCADVPAIVRDPERIDKAFWVHLDHLLKDRPFCLLHGDTHPGNGFVDADGSPGFFDWQTIAKGPWAFDVAYHIVTSLDVSERRRWEVELIRFYLDRLAASGVRTPPTFNTAWLQYRRYIAYGLHIWITNPAHFQSEANCTALTTRLAVAAADLDFFEAWGV